MSKPNEIRMIAGNFYVYEGRASSISLYDTYEDNIKNITISELLDEIPNFSGKALDEELYRELNPEMHSDVFISSDGKLVYTIGNIKKNYMSSKFWESVEQSDLPLDSKMFPKKTFPYKYKDTIFESKTRLVEELIVNKMNMLVLIKHKVILPFNILIFKPRREIFARDPQSMGYPPSVLPFLIDRVGKGDGIKFIDQGLLKRDFVNDDFSLIVAICPMVNNNIGMSRGFIDLKKDKWIGSDFFNLKWATLIKSFADVCYGQ